MRAIQSLHALENRDMCELIVIENGSEPSGRAMVETVLTGYPYIRLIHERRTGLSYARNCGIRESRAPFIAFLDDDAEMAPDWPQIIVNTLESHKHAGIAGGNILLEFLEKPPEWLRDAHRNYIGEFDMGDTQLTLQYPHYPRGSNIAFRRSALDALPALFNPRFGKIGQSLMCFEEIDLCYRLEQAGWASLYVPEAHVTHLIEPFRFELSWYMRRAYEQGKAVRLFERTRSLQRSLTPMDNLQMLRHPDILQRKFNQGYIAGSLMPIYGR